MKNNINHVSKVLDTVIHGYIQALYFTDTGDSEQPDSNDDMSTAAVNKQFGVVFSLPVEKRGNFIANFIPFEIEVNQNETN